MVTILKKIFVKDNLTEAEQRTAIGKLCGIAGIVLNLVLFAGKLFAGIISGAVSITADAMNNLSDAGSSVTTLCGFKLAEQKPDREHPYGHGRMEYIAGFIVSVIIFIVGFELLKGSLDKILHPSTTEISWLVVGILLVSILVKCYMAIYNFSEGKAIDSPTLRATGMDSLTDCIATSVVLLSAVICHFTGINLDGYAGIVVSGFVLFAGYSAAMDSINPLLGQQPEAELLVNIEKFAIDFNENIVGVHDMIVHEYGPGRRFVIFHAEVPAEGNILELHDVIDNLEHFVGLNYNCMCTIHMDPIVTKDPQVLALREKVGQLATKVQSDFTVHDFRIVPGDTHTNLIFDMVIPFECEYDETYIKNTMQQLIFDEIGLTYFAVIQFDIA